MTSSRRKPVEIDNGNGDSMTGSRRTMSGQMDEMMSPGGKDASLRKGKWTTEEENYANKIINLFNRGLLPIAAGTTLRSYLSDTLQWYVWLFYPIDIPIRISIDSRLTPKNTRHFVFIPNPYHFSPSAIR
jgi:hypothetical protein